MSAGNDQLRDAEPAPDPDRDVRTLTLKERRYFLAQLRGGRAQALRDAEGFPGLVHSIERLGFHLSGGRASGLWRMQPYLGRIAEASCLASEVPTLWPQWHTPFSTMLDHLRRARNEAAHEGVYARHLTQAAIEISIVLEDALAEPTMRISELMIRDPVCAEDWEPISFVRQKMIRDSFSFVPVRPTQSEKGWCFVSDRQLAAYLRHGDRKDKLKLSVAMATRDGLVLEPATCFSPSASIADVVPAVAERPVLIVDEANPASLLGILTAFDLL